MDDQHITPSKHFKNTAGSSSRPRRIKGRAPKKPQKIEEGLSHIYGTEGQEKPVAQELSRAPRRGKLGWIATIVLIIAILGGAAWLGYFVLNPKGSFSEEKIIFAVDATTELVAGEKITYRITFGNSHKLPLGQAEVGVRYPEGFTFESSSIESFNEEHTLWKIGGVRPGEVRTLDITGTLLGNANEARSLRAFFTYRPSNFNADFQKVATAATTIKGLAIEITLFAPETAVTGTDVPLVIAIKNTTETALNGIEVKLAAAGGVGVSTSTPPFSSDDTMRWVVGALSPHAEQKIFATSTISQIDGGEVLLAAQVSIAKENVRYVQAEASKTIKLQQANLVVQLFIQGSSDLVATQLGKSLNVSLAYANKGKVELKGASLVILLDTPSAQNKSLVNWDAFTPQPEPAISGKQLSPTVRRALLTWTKKEVPALAKVLPGEEKTIDFVIPLKNFEALGGTAFPALPVIATAEGHVTIDGKEMIYATKPIKITVLSDLDLTADTELITDAAELAALGATNNSVAYEVRFKMMNAYHPLEAVKLTTEIFGNARVVDASIKTTKGALTWDAATKKLIWNLGAMPKGENEHTASLTVVLAKDETQTALSGPLTVEAKDTVTGSVITVTKNPLAL